MSFPKWNAVLQIHGRKQSRCELYDALPIPDAFHICIIQDSGDRVAAYRIFDAITRRLAPYCGAPGSPSSCPSGSHGPVGRGCMARREPECRSILVAVTGTAPIDQSLGVEIDGWSRGGPYDLVLPVLPAGASPSHILRSRSRANAVFYHGDPELIADTILQSAGFGGTARRLFISYRRQDSRDIADQLFDRLNREGFEVFLDRFSGTPGRLFPEELAEEIVDKGVLLLLETPNVRNSPWTLAELGFAMLFGLGRLAINLNSAPESGIVHSADRHQVRLGPRTQTLSAAQLDTIVRFIRSRYAAQLLARRLFMEALLQIGLRPHGIVPNKKGGGIYEVSAKSNPQTYQIALAERTPEIAEVRRAARAAQAAGGRGVVLGPHQYLGPQRRVDFDWLVRNVDVRPMGEGEIMQRCAEISRGAL